jgi:glutathione S-transferase
MRHGDTFFTLAPGSSPLGGESFGRVRASFPVPEVEAASRYPQRAPPRDGPGHKPILATHGRSAAMKLHTFVGSPNGRKVEAVIDHLGLDVQIQYHDFLAGDLRSPDYVALNPNAKVPTLVDGAFVLWESNAIMQYLADKAPGNTLFPRDTQQRADIVRWQFWELAHFNRAFGTLAFETVIKPKLNLGPTDDALVATALTNLARSAPVLERHLVDRHYMVGEGITIADYSMICLESYRRGIAFDWKPYAHVNAYFDRMRNVKHWTRTAPATQSSLGRKPQAA